VAVRVIFGWFSTKTGLDFQWFYQTFTITKKLIFLFLGGHNEDLFSIIMLRFGGHVLLCPRYQPPLAKMSRKSNRKMAQTFVCFMFSLNIFSFAIKKHRPGDF
jgi:hypothetical protein